MNLYGKIAFNAVQSAIAPTMQKIMIESGLKIMRWTIGSAIIDFFTSCLYDYLGW